MAKTVRYIVIIISILLTASVVTNFVLWSRIDRYKLELNDLRSIPTELENEVNILRGERAEAKEKVDSLINVNEKIKGDLARNAKELQRIKSKTHEELNSAAAMSADERLDDVARRLSKVPKTP